jgi:hypothetical protein
MYMTPPTTSGVDADCLGAGRDGADEGTDPARDG